MWDSILEFVVVAVPTILGLAGWLMPVGEYRKRHRIVLLLGGIGLSALIVLQQQRARTKAETDRQAGETSQRQLRELLNNSLQRQEYMRGQLDSISVMVGTLGEKKGDIGIKSLADAIGKIGEKQRERFGKVDVAEGANEVTIKHGYTDPQRLVIVFAVPNWNTTVTLKSQNADSVTFAFNTSAIKDAFVSWRASKPD